MANIGKRSVVPADLTGKIFVRKFSKLFTYPTRSYLPYQRTEIMNPTKAAFDKLNTNLDNLKGNLDAILLAISALTNQQPSIKNSSQPKSTSSPPPKRRKQAETDRANMPPQRKSSRLISSKKTSSSSSQSSSARSSGRQDDSFDNFDSFDSASDELDEDSEVPSGDDDSSKSIHPSKCSIKTKLKIVGIKTKRELDDCSVSEDRFDDMIQIDPGFPPKLAEFAYDKLAEILNYHPEVDSEMNESTRQCIMHAWLYEIIQYIASKKIPKGALKSVRRRLTPKLITDESLIWWLPPTHSLARNNERRKVSGKLDINLHDPLCEEASWIVIEMKKDSLNAGMHQALVYLKRIRELTKSNRVGFCLPMICNQSLPELTELFLPDCLRL